MTGSIDVPEYQSAPYELYLDRRAAGALRLPVLRPPLTPPASHPATTPLHGPRLATASGPRSRPIARRPFSVKSYEPPTITCAANPSTVTLRRRSSISRTTGTSPQNRPLTYSYSTTAGLLTGTGSPPPSSTPPVSARQHHHRHLQPGRRPAAKRRQPPRPPLLVTAPDCACDRGIEAAVQHPVRRAITTASGPRQQ